MIVYLLFDQILSQGNCEYSAIAFLRASFPLVSAVLGVFQGASTAVIAQLVGLTIGVMCGMKR